MGISGRSFAHAEDFLEKQLADQLTRENLARAQQQQKFTNDLALTREGNDERYRTAQMDATERARRDASNRWGVEQQGRDLLTANAQDDRQRHRTTVDTLAADETIPVAARNFIRISDGDVRAPSDLESEDVKTKRETDKAARELKDFTQKEDVRGRMGLKYRAPTAADEPDQLVIDPKTGNQRLVSNRQAASLINSGWRFADASGAGTSRHGVSGAGGTGRGAEGKRSSTPALGVLDEIESLSQQINTASVPATGKGRFLTGPAATIEGMKRSALSDYNLDQPVAEYNALTESFTPMLARAVGHVGVLTQQDVDSVRAMLPQPGESKELAASKLARARRLIARMSPEEMNDLPLMPEEAKALGLVSGHAPAGGAPAGGSASRVIRMDRNGNRVK